MITIYIEDGKVKIKHDRELIYEVPNTALDNLIAVNKAIAEAQARQYKTVFFRRGTYRLPSVNLYDVLMVNGDEPSTVVFTHDTNNWR